MKTRNLRASVAITALAFGMSLPAMGQDVETVQEDETSVQEAVIVLGSRRASRSPQDTIAPVDIIDANDLNNQGDVDTVNILRTSVPSYNVNEQPISDAATLVRPANLRGLAPDSTLVLVNGKRRHRAAVIAFLGGGISDGSQGPDISVIPSIALKQVEVLRDGAASQYGSDAIAGVMNFALRDNDSGLIAEAQYGSTYEGDGDQFRLAANLGLPLSAFQGGFVNLSAQFKEVKPTSRSVQRDDALGLIAAGNSAVASANVNTVSAEAVQIWGQPEVRGDFTFFGNSALQITDNVEAYLFGNYAEREVEGGFFFRNPTNRGGVFSGDGGDTLLVGDLTADGTGDCPTIAITGGIPDPAGIAAINADADCFAFTELFPGGFTPRFGGELEDRSLVFGLRGDISGFNYDLSYSYGRNDVDFSIRNTINASLGPDTPTSFNPGGYSQIDNNFNLDVSYGIANNIFASDINLAAGAEYREEKFEIRAGDPFSYALGPLAQQGFSSSSNGFGGFNPSNAGTTSQENYAVYVDTEFDATEALTLQAALRYEDFTDSFGDTLNYKVGARYQVTDDFSLRSTFSTGFHAPTAGQANVTNVTTAFSGAILVDQGTLPLTSAAGQLVADFLEGSTGSRPELGPEESENFSIGFGYGVGDFNITMDYFRINVSDRIAISDQQDFLEALTAIGASNGVTITDGTTTFGALSALDAAGVLNVADFAGSEDLTSFGFFTNSFDTRTQGIDVVASSSYEFYDDSNTNFSLAFNWTDTEVTDIGADGPAPLSLGRQRQLEENLPAFRGNFAINHTHGDFRGLARVNFFGEFFECHLDSVNDDPATNGCDLPIDGSASVTVDLEAGYQLMENLEIAIGARNAFDTSPTENPFSGVAGAAYPTTAPNGFNGGSYYFRVRQSF